MYYVTTIHPSGEQTRETLEHAPDHKWIKARLADGWLEIAPHFEQYGDKPCVAFCDEEGKLKGLAMNGKATYLWYACLAPEPFIPDTLHGPVVIVAADTQAEIQEL